LLGKRGEGWVAIQLLLFVAILLSPVVQEFAFPLWLRLLGLPFLALGGILGTLGIFGLGQNLTAFPRPKEGGYLVSTGVYGIVRHPIYSGLVFGTLGWAVLTDTLLGIALAVVLFLFFDQKSRREERWLKEAYHDYPAYQQRVKKLIPWVY
jgi:protein-S-isoprenylcysteine O-methyltransferase Ste14